MVSRGDDKKRGAQSDKGKRKRAGRVLRAVGQSARNTVGDLHAR